METLLQRILIAKNASWFVIKKCIFTTYPSQKFSFKINPWTWPKATKIKSTNKTLMENKKGRKERRELERGLDVRSSISFWVGFIDVDASFLEKNLLSFRTCFLIWRDFLLRTQVSLHTWKEFELERIRY